MRAFHSIRSFSGAAVLAAVLTCAACGGGGSSSTGGAGSTGKAGSGSTGSAGAAGSAAGAGAAGTPSGTPVALCKALVSTICMRLKSCNVLSDPTTFVEADCENAENVEFGCDRAASTAFPDCVSDVQTVSCAGLFSATQGLVLPPSCDDPVNMIPLSAAQMKCADLAAADCTRFFQCVGVNPTSDDMQQCQIDDYAQAGCGLATDVGPTYDQCLMDLGKAPCPVDGGAPPDGGVASCGNAIVFVQ